MIFLFDHILVIRLRNHYVVYKFDPIPIMRLRNHYVVSILIRLRNHCVISQFDPILIIRLRNNYVVSQFDPILVICLKTHCVVSQKLCISESKQLFLGLFVGDCDGRNSTALLTLVRLTSFQLKSHTEF